MKTQEIVMITQMMKVILEMNYITLVVRLMKTIMVQEIKTGFL